MQSFSMSVVHRNVNHNTYSGNCVVVSESKLGLIPKVGKGKAPYFFIEEDYL